MTKKLKEIVITAINESKKNISGSGVAPKIFSGSGVAPEEVHFRMRKSTRHKSKPSKSPLEEESSSVKIKDWLNERENAHDSDTITKQLSKDAKPLSKEHEETLRSYTGTTSADINKKLIDDHNGKKTDSNGPLSKEYTQKTIKNLDEITSDNPIRRHLHVYSGLGFDPSQHMNSQGHLYMPAFTSVTHDKRVAHRFAQDSQDAGSTKDKHILHIQLRPSDRATHVSGLSYEPEEHESILPRRTTLKIHPTPTILSDGTHVWHAQVHHQD